MKERLLFTHGLCPDIVRLIPNLKFEPEANLLILNYREVEMQKTPSDHSPSPEVTQGPPVSEENLNQEDFIELNNLEPTSIVADSVEPTSVIPLPKLGLATGSLPQEDDWAEFLSPLPLEAVEIILTHIRSPDLFKVSHVNRLANWLACRIHLHRLQHALSLSVFWQYLPNIANDSQGFNGVLFNSFLTRFPGPKTFRIDKFSSFFNMYRKRGNLPLNWNGIPVHDLKEFQECASKILSECHIDPSKPPQSLDEFMSGCSSRLTVRELRKLWQAYHTLESLISTMVLFLEIPLLKQWYQALGRIPFVHNSFNTIIDFLIFSQETRFLTGFGLITLDQLIPGVLRRLVEEALRLDWMKEKSDQEKTRLMRLECLLDRLTEKDLLAYQRKNENPTPYSGEHIPSHRKLFVDVLQFHYSLLLKKFTARIILNIDPRITTAPNYLDKYQIIPKILESEILLDNLRQDGIITLLLRSPLSHKKRAILSFPALKHHFTYELISKWMAQESDKVREECVCLLLSENEVLNRLENNQIALLAQYLNGEVIEVLINTQAFQYRLMQEDSKIKKPDITLLMQLAVLGDIELIDMILNSRFFAPKLKPDEKAQLEDRIKSSDQIRSRYVKIDLADVKVQSAADRVEGSEILSLAEEQDLATARTLSKLASQKPSHKAVHELKEMAHKFQNKPSSVWQALGLALLGLALTIAGVLTMAVSIGALSTGFFAPPAVAGTIGGVELMGSGLALLGVAATTLSENRDDRSLVCS